MPRSTSVAMALTTPSVVAGSMVSTILELDVGSRMREYLRLFISGGGNGWKTREDEAADCTNECKPRRHTHN